MIVVAIVGILAAIALPQYQTYVARTQVTRTVAELGALRTAIEMCILDGKKDAHDCGPIFTSSSLLQPIGNTSPSLSDGAPYLSMLPDGQVMLTGTFGGGAAAVLNNRVIMWRRNLDSSWTCMSDLEPKLQSASCTEPPPRQGE